MRDFLVDGFCFLFIIEAVVVCPLLWWARRLPRWKFLALANLVHSFLQRPRDGFLEKAMQILAA